MKVIVSSFLLLLFAATASYAQPGAGGRERIHAAKMAYITDKLDLTADQAGQFVPLYKEYEQDLRNTRRPYLKKYHLEHEEQDLRASRQYVEEDLDYQQEVIALKRKYNDRFLKILTQRQLTDMYIAEREFRQILIRRLNQRSGGRRPGR